MDNCEHVQTFFQVLDIATRECDADFVDFGGSSSRKVVLLILIFGNVTHG